MVPGVRAAAVHLAGPQRALGQRGRDHGVERREEPDQRSGHRLQPVLRHQVGDRVLLARPLPDLPGERLDVLLGGVAPGQAASDPGGHRHRRPEQAAEVREQLGTAPRWRDLLHAGGRATRASVAASRAACSHTGSSSAPSSGALNAKPMFSVPGGLTALSVYARSGGGAQLASPSSGPARTSSAAAVSTTVRVSTPSPTRKLSPASGPTETRPRAGLRPTRPQQAAGMRIEPPPSLPCAIGTMPAATAAAAPPLEPPGVRSRSHGLRVGPNRRDSVVGRIPISGSAVLPTITNPASRSRLTRYASWSRDQVPEQVAAHRQRHPGDRAVVLDRDRHARERPRIAWLDLLGDRQRRIRRDMSERVDRRLQLLDPRERRARPARRRSARRSGPGARAPWQA